MIMELNSIVESLEQKSILVTGATGFLAKIFVEKLLRVQPNLKHLFLLVRAPNASAATQRIHNEVLRKEVFRVLRTKYGTVGFDSFISEKVIPVAGDVALENLEINDSKLKEMMWKEVDIIANFAATTDSNERYDIAFGINTMGAKHVLDFAKKCVKPKMVLQISTAYVWGEKSGILLENPLKMGETLNGTLEDLDCEIELKLMAQRLEELQAKQVSKKEETNAMKELGLKRARLFGWPNTYSFTKAMGEMVIGQLRGDVPVVILRPTAITSTYKEPFPGWIEGVRTVDILLLDIGKGRVKCFRANPKNTPDLIPGDMVVNAAIVAMMAHANQPSDFMIYQVGSSARAPLNILKLRDVTYDYFCKNPLNDRDGKPIKISYPIFFHSMASFLMYLHITSIWPLKGLQLVNMVFCDYYRGTCDDTKRNINSVIRLVKLFEPFAMSEGIFDDMNTERLGMAMGANRAEANTLCSRFDDMNTEKLGMAMGANPAEANTFYFDPTCINWDDYLMNIHIPGLLKYGVKC